MKVFETKKKVNAEAEQKKDREQLIEFSQRQETVKRRKHNIVMSYDEIKLFGGRIGKQFAEAQYDCKK